ncbi:hypothetical protein L7F22_015598 [Adiantum nelumboides]|nr:hypothetical protein [Adiantum nelumboides]
MVVENACTSSEYAIDTKMTVSADMEKEQEEKGNECETANESMPDIVPKESVGTMDESQELVVAVDKSQEEIDDTVGEPRSAPDFLSHIVCNSGSQNTTRLTKKKKKKK